MNEIADESAPPIPSPPAVVEEKAVPEPAQGRRNKSDLAERDADQRNQEPLGQVGPTKATEDAARKTREESSGRTDSATTFRAELPAGAPPAAPRAAAPPSPPTPANVTPLGEPQRQAVADEQRAAERPREAAAKAATAPPPASLVMMSREAATVAFSAPDGSRRWRIVSGTRVERSSDGVVWEMVPMPAPGSLVNGHAPSASVAWVVGRAGTIFLTSDGGRFEPVPFPEAVDLSTVVAIDDRQASVTTADGRTFVTSDRGANWRRQ